MSDMPETLWAWISPVQFVPSTQVVGEFRQWWTTPPMDNPSAGTEYIRADVHAARIADLERQLAEKEEQLVSILQREAATAKRHDDRTDKLERQLAVAVMVQRAADVVNEVFQGDNPAEIAWRILALAPADALAEVERLRAERDAAQHFNRQLRDEIVEYQLVRDDLAAEVARLTGYLQQIESISVHSGGEIHGVDPSAWRYAFGDARDIARAALTPEKDATT